MGEKPGKLSRNQRRRLLAIARSSIQARLDGADPPEGAEADADMPASGAFVTVKVNGRLRGCIGRIESDSSLVQVVAMMAAAAAFDDPRFPAIASAEMRALEIEVSVLSTLLEIHSPDEVTVGRDGLVVETDVTRGLLLPQVATERHWDAQTFLEQTCVKAMLAPDAWRGEDVSVYRFEADVFSEADPGPAGA